MYVVVFLLFFISTLTVTLQGEGSYCHCQYWYRTMSIPVDDTIITAFVYDHFSCLAKADSPVYVCECTVPWPRYLTCCFYLALSMSSQIWMARS